MDDSATTNQTSNNRGKSALDRFFASIGQGFNAYLAARSRIDQIERLEAMSDSQLAELGLKREDIPRYVFRDLLHL